MSSSALYLSPLVGIREYSRKRKGLVDSSDIFGDALKDFLGISRFLGKKRSRFLRLKFAPEKNENGHVEVVLKDDEGCSRTIARPLPENFKNLLLKHKSGGYPLSALASFFLSAMRTETQNPYSEASEVLLEYKDSVLTRAFGEMGRCVAPLYTSGFLKAFINQKEQGIEEEIEAFQNELLHKVFKEKEQYEQQEDWFWPEICDKPYYPSRLVSYDPSLLDISALAKHESVQKLLDTRSIPSLTAVYQVMASEQKNILMPGFEQKLEKRNKLHCYLGCVGEVSHVVAECQDGKAYLLTHPKLYKLYA